MTPQVVLMIDEDPDSYDRVRRYLDQDLYDLHYAPDPYEGVKLAKELQPDSIILDIRMPELDGYEICQRLRSHEATQGIPIIIYSVLGNEDLAFTRGYNLGAHAVVEKEKLSRLVAALRRFLGQESDVTPQVRRCVRERHELKIQGEAERVWLDDEEKILRPKARKLLACLASRPGVFFSSEELVEELYDVDERFERGPGDIHRLIHDLRAEVEPHPKDPLFIENVPRTGYRLRNEDDHSAGFSR